MHHIPPGDCLVSQVCEYHLQTPFFNSGPQIGKFKIQIPHIVKDLKKMKPHVKVRYGNLHGDSLVKVKGLNNCHTDTIQYDIDDKYVTIYTSHFSGYIVTAEAIKCCAESAYVLFFGSLRNESKEEPLATVSVHFASTHISMKDYKSVSNLM